MSCWYDISAFVWVFKNFVQHTDGAASRTDQTDKCFHPQWKYRELIVLWNIKKEEVFMQVTPLTEAVFLEILANTE